MSIIRPLIKVCGMRDSENIRAVESLHPDWMGFIFWPKSKRFVSQLPAYLPTTCKRVGVFVDEDIEQVKCVANEYALDIIQLHGSESPHYASQLHQWKVIKAFNIATAADLKQTRPYENIVDYFLFDTKASLPGGSGLQFDWSILCAYHTATPFLLSGGIGPNDAPALRQAFALDGFPVEKCLGIDLNSCFELAPGLKDTDALRRFFEAIKS